MNWLFAFLINAGLVAVSHKIPVLTKVGWIHSATLGTILWGTLGFRGWFSVVVYLILGSIVTKIGATKKKLLGVEEIRSGKRGPSNVWGSAGTGLILSILIGLGIGSKELMLIAFSASFSAKLGDTFGSEIGKLYGKRSYLITTLRRVKVGTDGAISFEGTIASAVGCSLMALIVLILGLVTSFKNSIVVALVGFISTLCESVFGALFQKGKITNELTNFIQTTFSSLLAILVVIFSNR